MTAYRLNDDENAGARLAALGASFGARFAKVGLGGAGAAGIRAHVAETDKIVGVRLGRCAARTNSS
jgi:hypothetical protein